MTIYQVHHKQTLTLIDYITLMYELTDGRHTKVFAWSSIDKIKCVPDAFIDSFV